MDNAYLKQRGRNNRYFNEGLNWLIWRTNVCVYVWTRVFVTLYETKKKIGNLPNDKIENNDEMSI